MKLTAELTTFLYLISCNLCYRAATDHNLDNTTAMLREWLTVVQKHYHYVEWRPMDQPT